MMRPDGRSRSTLRPVGIILESLDRVDGSASFSFGATKALASVSGPIQVRLAAELPSKATFEVLVRPLSGIPGTEYKSIAMMLRASLLPSIVLTQNPRTLVQLVVQSLAPQTTSSNLALISAFINASTLALLRASSFPMLGVVCAVAVGRVKDRNSDGSRIFLLDPIEQELSQCDIIGCVAVMFRSSTARKAPEAMDEDAEEEGNEMVWSFFQGGPLQSDYDALLRLAKSGAKSVYNAIRDRLREEVEGTGLSAQQHAKKIPKYKGGRVNLNVGTEDTMDTT